MKLYSALIYLLSAAVVHCEGGDIRTQEASSSRPSDDGDDLENFLTERLSETFEIDSPAKSLDIEGVSIRVAKKSFARPAEVILKSYSDKVVVSYGISVEDLVGVVSKINVVDSKTKQPLLKSEIEKPVTATIRIDEGISFDDVQVIIIVDQNKIALGSSELVYVAPTNSDPNGYIKFEISEPKFIAIPTLNTVSVNKITVSASGSTDTDDDSGISAGNSASITCPSTYGPMAPVPGNSDLGVSSFCVFKYEAKQGSEGKATSQASELPWTGTWTEAVARCNSETLGEGYSLISNAQWQTLARNIEAQTTNWIGDKLLRGNTAFGNWSHSEQNRSNEDATEGPVSAVAASDDDENGCFNLTEKNDSEQFVPYTTCGIRNRVFTLSNGSKIWDVTGNEQEWVRDSVLIRNDNSAKIGDIEVVPNLYNHSQSFHESANNKIGMNTVNRTLFGPAVDYTIPNYEQQFTHTTNNTGVFSGWVPGQWAHPAGTAIARGGVAGVGTAGLFNTWVRYADRLSGFRCVYE